MMLFCEQTAIFRPLHSTAAFEAHAATAHPVNAVGIHPTPRPVGPHKDSRVRATHYLVYSALRMDPAHAPTSRKGTCN